MAVDGERRAAVRERIAEHALRSSLLVAIAPMATIASIAGCDGCIEPVVSNLFERETLSGELPQVDGYLARAAISRPPGCGTPTPPTGCGRRRDGASPVDFHHPVRPYSDPSRMHEARPQDQQLLGLRPSEVPGEVRLTLAPHLSRIDGRLYGGTALAVALAAAEVGSGRPALWATTQLVGTTEVGSEIVVAIEEVARGRSTSQVQVDARVDGRLIFTGVAATADPIPDGLSGIGPPMPEVPAPDDCPVLWGPDRAPWFVGPDGDPGTGQHHACEFRIATIAAGSGDGRPDRRALWSRLVPPVADPDAPITPAGLGFVGDMVPLAVAAACGVQGGGTSIDQTLRLGEPARHPWVLLDIEAEVAHGGFGHGRAVMWSPDGRVVGVASQTARLITFTIPPT